MLGSIVLFFFLISEEGSESRETLTDGNVFMVVTLEHAGCGSHPGAIRATMQKLFKSRPLTTTTACVVLGGAINSCQGRGSSFSLSPRVVPSLPSRPELAPLILFSVCPVSAAAASRSLPSPSPDPPFLGATNGLSRPIARRQHEPAREPQPRQTSGNFHHINIILGTNTQSKLSQEHQKVQIQALIQKKTCIQGQVYLH